MTDENVDQNNVDQQDGSQQDTQGPAEPRVWRNITVAQRQNIVKMYEQGMSIRAIAETYGRSYGGVHHVLALEGVVMRSKGSPSPAARQSKEANKKGTAKS